MACFYTGSAEGDARYDADRAREALTKMTQIACEACQVLEDIDEIYLAPNAKKWWKEHKKIDAKRLAQEQNERNKKALQASGLAKLSPEERKALGV